MEFVQSFNYSPALKKSVRLSVILSFRPYSILFNILRMNERNETKLCIHIDKIYIDIVKRHFFANLHKIMALG